MFSFVTTSLGLHAVWGANSLAMPHYATAGMEALTPRYTPAVLTGMQLYPDNPFKFTFILNQGDAVLTGAQMQKESSRLIRYFLTALTIPENELWVNLSPYEKSKVSSDALAVTDMGEGLLGQDYALKQLASSITYPESPLGKQFWQKVYQRAQEVYHTTNIPIATFNKVWIMPDKVVMYQEGDRVVIGEAKLKVMMEEDYLAAQRQDNLSQDHKVTRPQEEKANNTIQNKQPKPAITQANDIATQIMKEIILPVVEKEVNEGKSFAQLRQIYHSLVLAAWFKSKLKESVNEVLSVSRLSQFENKNDTKSFNRLNRQNGLSWLNRFINKKKLKGIDTVSPQVRANMYQAYVAAYKKGAYDYIKKEYEVSSRKQVRRRYFSGGANFGIQFDVNAGKASVTAAGGSQQIRFEMYNHMPARIPVTHQIPVELKQVRSAAMPLGASPLSSGHTRRHIQKNKDITQSLNVPETPRKSPVRSLRNQLRIQMVRNKRELANKASQAFAVEEKTILERCQSRAQTQQEKRLARVVAQLVNDGKSPTRAAIARGAQVSEATSNEFLVSIKEELRALRKNNLGKQWYKKIAAITDMLSSRDLDITVRAIVSIAGMSMANFWRVRKLFPQIESVIQRAQRAQQKIKPQRVIANAYARMGIQVSIGTVWNQSIEREHVAKMIDWAAGKLIAEKRLISRNSIAHTVGLRSGFIARYLTDTELQKIMMEHIRKQRYLVVRDALTALEDSGAVISPQALYAYVRARFVIPKKTFFAWIQQKDIRIELRAHKMWVSRGYAHILAVCSGWKALQAAYAPVDSHEARAAIIKALEVMSAYGIQVAFKRNNTETLFTLPSFWETSAHIIEFTNTRSLDELCAVGQASQGVLEIKLDSNSFLSERVFDFIITQWDSLLAALSGPASEDSAQKFADGIKEYFTHLEYHKDFVNPHVNAPLSHRELITAALARMNMPVPNIYVWNDALQKESALAMWQEAMRRVVASGKNIQIGLVLQETGFAYRQSIVSDIPELAEAFTQAVEFERIQRIKKAIQALVENGKPVTGFAVYTQLGIRPIFFKSWITQSSKIAALLRSHGISVRRSSKRSARSASPIVTHELQDKAELIARKKRISLDAVARQCKTQAEEFKSFWQRKRAALAGEPGHRAMEVMQSQLTYAAIFFDRAVGHFRKRIHQNSDFYLYCAHVFNDIAGIGGEAFFILDRWLRILNDTQEKNSQYREFYRQAVPVMERVTRGDDFLGGVVFAQAFGDTERELTPDSASMAVSLRVYTKGRVIPAHRHAKIQGLDNALERAQEGIWIKQGKAEVSLYTDEGRYVNTITLGQGEYAYVHQAHSITFTDDSSVVFVHPRASPQDALAEEAVTPQHAAGAIEPVNSVPGIYSFAYNGQRVADIVKPIELISAKRQGKIVAPTIRFNDADTQCGYVRELLTANVLSRANPAHSKPEIAWHPAVAGQFETRNEMLFPLTGEMVVDFYTTEGVFVEQKTVSAGDAVIITAGHRVTLKNSRDGGAVIFMEFKGGPQALDKNKETVPVKETLISRARHAIKDVQDKGTRAREERASSSAVMETLRAMPQMAHADVGGIDLNTDSMAVDMRGSLIQPSRADSKNVSQSASSASSVLFDENFAGFTFIVRGIVPIHLGQDPFIEDISATSTAVQPVTDKRT